MAIGRVRLFDRPTVAGRQPVADALPRHAEPLGHVALVAELPVGGDRLPLLARARADQRVDETAERAEQHVAGLAGAEVARQSLSSRTASCRARRATE